MGSIRSRDGADPAAGSPDAIEGRALRSVAMMFWVNGMIFASFLPRLPEIRDRIGVDLGRLGLLLTLGSLGGLLGSALCGPLIARFGTKRVMTAGALGMVGVLPTIGWTTGTWTFLAALVAMHLFDVLTDVSMNIQGSRLSARRSVPVMNRLHGLWSVGGVVGGAAAAVAASTISLRAHLVVVAAVLTVTLSYVGPGLSTDDGRPDPTGPTVRSGHLPVSAIVFALLAVLAVGVETVPADWAAVRLSDDLALPPGPAGLGFVAVTTGMVVGRLGGDLATARLGLDRLTAVAAAASGLGIAMATLVPEPALSVGGFAIAGLGASVMFPALYDQAARAPGRPGVAVAAVTAGIRIGALVLPVTVGAVAATDPVSVGGAIALVTIPAAIGLVVLRGRSG